MRTTEAAVADGTRGGLVVVQDVNDQPSVDGDLVVRVLLMDDPIWSNSTSLTTVS